MGPVVIYTILYTLEGKNVASNKYIDMYYIWLFNIVKYAKLQDQDYCITLVDENTYDFISNNIVLEFIKTFIKNIWFIKVPIIKNSKDGMLNKYRINDIYNIVESIEEKNPYFLYLDVDVEVTNDIRKLFVKNIDNGKPTMYIRAENYLLTNTMFYGELITEEEKQVLKEKKMENLSGFSAGIFGWRGKKEKIYKFFEYIMKRSLIDSNFYTVEQPFFNSAIFNYFFKELGLFNFVIWDDRIVLDNSAANCKKPETVLINFCGDPGEEKLHWDKILLYLFSDNFQNN